MRQQPQQGVPLDRSTRIGAGAVAVVTPTLDVNWATGKQLTRSGTGYGLAALGGCQTLNFRKNFYLETETLPAVGTSPYVMFWLGWPQAVGSQASSSEAAFVVGSSNNSLGICTNLGSNRSILNSPNGPNMWGGGNNTWSSGIWSSGDTLTIGTTGAPVFLMIVRHVSGLLEFYRNGVLVNSAPQSTNNVAAFKLIVGSFINGQTGWTVSCNTVLAGLSILSSDPTAAELQAFAANPWILFEAPSNLPLMAALLASTSSGSTPGALLVPSGVARTSGGGSLSTGTTLSTQGVQAASGAASIQTVVSLTAAGPMASVGSASLSTTPAVLSASGVARCSGSAGLTASVSMSLTAAASVSGAASLSAAGTWAVQSACSTSAGAALTTTSQFAAAAIIKASAAAAVTTQVALGAVAKAGTSAHAAMSAGVKLALAVTSKASGNAVLTVAQQGDFDLSKISPARIVVFEGSGSRIVPFEGSGSRVVPFEGSGSRVVVFEGSGSRKVRFE
jgi:hypothetical protein